MENTIKFSSSNYVISKKDLKTETIERVESCEKHKSEYRKVKAILDDLKTQAKDRDEKSKYLYGLLAYQTALTFMLYYDAILSTNPHLSVGGLALLATQAAFLELVDINYLYGLVKNRIQKNKVQSIFDVEKEKEDEIRRIAREEEEKKAKEPIQLTESEKNEKERYISFLLENNADSKIIEMPAIQRIMDEAIHDNPSRHLQQPHPPIRYNKPKPDGTFDIQIMDITGDSISLEMEYCNEDSDEHYIKLTQKDRKTVHYLMDDPIGDDYDVDDITTIYINKEGRKVDTSQNREIVR